MGNHRTTFALLWRFESLIQSIIHVSQWFCRIWWVTKHFIDYNMRNKFKITQTFSSRMPSVQWQAGCSPLWLKQRTTGAQLQPWCRTSWLCMASEWVASWFLPRLGQQEPWCSSPVCYIQSELPRALIKLFPADAQQLSLLKMLWKRKVGSRKPSFPLFVISRLVRWKQNSPLRRRGAGRSRLRSDPERMEESNGAALSEALLQKLQLKMVNNVLWIKYF